ncbi:MAG: 6-carboxytetrahydropterin synthase QueD [Desulfovibrionaceae bacterium]
MMAGTWKLTVRREFSASHQLRHYGGKCERMHGHNFGVEVVVEGERLDPDIEYLVDFGDLKRLTDEILARLDHRHLNETPPFDRVNPSSERIAEHVYTELAPRLAAVAPRVRLVEVSVSEKPQQRATYSER